MIILASQLKAQDEKPAFDFNGYVRNYTGVLLSNGNDFSIIQNTLNLNFEKQTDKIGFKANPYIYHYFDKKMELGLRELYVDLHMNYFDLRVGKQQIIYGKTDGVFITDVVSPKDLSEFLLRDFDEIRMGITAAKLDFYLGNHTFEAVWVPTFTPTKMPDRNSIWFPKMNFPIQPTIDSSTAQVEDNLKNGELYFRYSAMLSRIDYEFVTGTFYYDDPTLHITKEINPATMQLTGIIARPEYNRVYMAGGSFSLPIGPFVIRGEGAYYNGRYFQTQNPNIPDGTIQKNFIHYAAGLDYTIYGVRLSMQFIQEHILDYEKGICNDEYENTMTFLAKKDFFREKLWLEFFTYYGLNNNDALIRPKITYNFADAFNIDFGANIFTGTTGRFGMYHDNSMLYVKFKYNF